MQDEYDRISKLSPKHIVDIDSAIHTQVSRELIKKIDINTNLH
jgi:DNA-binding transcriptional regulator YdaS (Cro superfamily)